MCTGYNAHGVRVISKQCASSCRLCGGALSIPTGLVYGNVQCQNHKSKKHESSKNKNATKTKNKLSCYLVESLETFSTVTSKVSTVQREFPRLLANI